MPRRSEQQLNKGKEPKKEMSEPATGSGQSESLRQAEVQPTPKAKKLTSSKSTAQKNGDKKKMPKRPSIFAVDHKPLPHSHLMKGRDGQRDLLPPFRERKRGRTQFTLD